jgi:hypothetical protein
MEILDSRISLISGDFGNPCIGMSESLTIGLLEIMEIH